MPTRRRWHRRSSPTIPTVGGATCARSATNSSRPTTSGNVSRVTAATRTIRASCATTWIASTTATEASPRVGQKINVPGLLVGASASDPSLIYTLDYRWNGDSSVNEFDVLKLDGDTAYLQSSVLLPGWVGNTFVRGNRAYMSSQSYAQDSARSELGRARSVGPAFTARAQRRRPSRAGAGWWAWKATGHWSAPVGSIKGSTCIGCRTRPRPATISSSARAAGAFPRWRVKTIACSCRAATGGRRSSISTSRPRIRATAPRERRGIGGERSLRRSVVGISGGRDQGGPSHTQREFGSVFFCAPRPDTQGDAPLWRLTVRNGRTA